ncbi:hypothetical protein GA0074695_6024 [Micromonospora viridifaciens]|uniref:LPXTG-motif cell wall anchor domain-containing protein n=1 Tax=Micromonospora viridifaciens TaxID=1881 RepID=A0A1C4ZRP7_MICVI|nr:hypothetical protein [Micromonospora viridifaciens]SCF35710.1 hypothetical protein GA0074695_6024 [Micromonospora viridifaciens]
MSVWRHAARVATVGVMLGGLVAVAASPALADDDRVNVRSARSFTVGGSPETVAVEVRKRTDGCVLLRTALGLRLDGVRPDQVRVEVNTGGSWRPVGVSGGGGGVATAPVAPDRPSLCKGKGATVRYRVAFLAGAPGGRLTVIGAATTAAGRVLGQADTSARVVGAAPSPSPTRTASPTPTPTPSDDATVSPGEADPPSAVAAAVDPAGKSRAADSSSGGSPFMWFGIGLVLVGAALIVLLVRRSRADKVDEHAAGYPQVPLPRSAVGTTYRAGAPVGQVYGQQKPPTPTVYGGTSSPRPAGNVYGTPAAGRPVGEPPVGPAGDATSVLPDLPR